MLLWCVLLQTAYLVWRKVMFSQASVCPMGGVPTRGICLLVYLPGVCLPVGGRGLAIPPRTHHSPGHTPPPPGHTTAPWTPPPQGYTRIWSIGGWYASYWNAFLLLNEEINCRAQISETNAFNLNNSSYWSGVT